MSHPIGATRAVLAVAVLLIGLGIGCDTSDVSGGGPCHGGTCGDLDTHYNSTFYCPPRPLVPGDWYGYPWHSNANCHDECAAASNRGCDQPTGSGTWLPCNPANGGTVTAGGCSLASSGVHGETVPCVCR